MQLASSAAAIPAVALFPTAAGAAPNDRSQWNRAVAELKTIQGEYQRISDAQDEAHRASDAMCPREDEFFSRYNLGCCASRKRNVGAAETQIYGERVSALPKTGRQYLTDEECDQVRADAERVVDKFDSWLTRRDDADNHYSCDQWDEAFDAIADKRHEAREALLNTPAPDHAAVLVKLELLLDIMDGDQDYDYVAAVRDDARRLSLQ